MTLNTTNNTVTVNGQAIPIVGGSINVSVQLSELDNGFGPYRNGDIITRDKDVPAIFQGSPRDKWHTYGDESNQWTIYPSRSNFPIVLINLRSALGSMISGYYLEEDLLNQTCFGLRLGSVFHQDELEVMLQYLKTFNFNWEQQAAWYRRDCFAERGEYRHLLPTAEDFPIRLIRFPEPLVVLDKFDSEASLLYKYPVKKYLDHFFKTETLYYALPCPDNDTYSIYNLGLTNKNRFVVDQITAIKSMYESGIALFFTIEQARAYAEEMKGVDHYV